MELLSGPILNKAPHAVSGQLHMEYYVHRHRQHTNNLYQEKSETNTDCHGRFHKRNMNGGLADPGY